MALDRGHRMRGVGITVDFAPVVDVTDAADDTVIGDRSFGSDPAKVTAYADAYARGLRDAGLLPVLKHFPGHGHGSGDSHTGGVVTPPLDQLQNDDLVPYRTLFDRRRSASWSATCRYPVSPATSRRVSAVPPYSCCVTTRVLCPGLRWPGL